MSATAELRPAAPENDARRHENAPSPSAQETSGEQYGGLLGSVFSGAAREPSAEGAARLLSSSAFSHSANSGLRAISLKRAQQTHGNRFAQRVVGGIQRKPVTSRIVQRECACGGMCEKCREGGIALSAVESSAPDSSLRLIKGRAASTVRLNVPESEDKQVIPSRSPGEPLDEQTRGVMESRFGTDFRDVLIHADSQAAASAKSLGANAYTIGRDIYFAAGKYAPENDEGKRLLAHELAHTIQQRENMPSLARKSASASDRIIDPDDSLERVADRAAGQIVSSAPVRSEGALNFLSVQQEGNTAIQRDCDPTISSCIDSSADGPVTTSGSRGTSVAEPGARGSSFNDLFNQSFPKTQPNVNLPNVNQDERQVLLQMEFKPTLDLLLSENLQSQNRLRNYDQNAFGTGGGIGVYRRQWSITSLGSRTGILRELDRSKTALDSTLYLANLTSAGQIAHIEDNFLSRFRGKAKEIAFYMLDQSEHVTKSEYDRYTNMPVDRCPSVLPELRASAQRLADFQYELVNLMNATAMIFNADAPWGYPEGPTNITADDYYKYLGGSVFSSDRQVQSQLINFRKAIQEEGLKFPVLMKERLNYIKLGYEMSDVQLKNSILGHTVEVMENIRKSRKNIDDDNIWELEPVIKATIDLLGLKPGSYSHGYITKFLSDRKRNKTILDIFLSAVGVLLAIVAIFATGGLAAFAIVGGAAIGGYQTYQHLKEYNFQTAARGSAFDINKSIGANFDPSYASIVFDVAMTLVGFAQAASALRGIRAASQAASVVSKEATAIERVVASAGDLGLEANVMRFANAKGFIAEKVSDDVIRLTHPQLEGEFILTRQSLRYQTPTGTGGMRSEFEIPLIREGGPTKPPALPSPDADIDAAFARLASGEGPPGQGAMLGDLMFHQQRAEAIDELRRQLGNLPGRPGRTPPGVAVNPQPGYQSAHSAAQSTLRTLPGYDPGEMITRFLPTGRGHPHTLFDQHWQAQFRAIRSATGRTTTTAQEVYEVTARAARQSGAFSPAEAQSVVDLVMNDLFFQLRLSPTQTLRMPGT